MEMWLLLQSMKTTVLSQEKKSLLGFMGGRAFDGSKEFYYVDMTSVQYKKANAFINGFIQFEYPGSHSGQKILIVKILLL